MKYRDVKEVLPSIKEKSKKDIDAVNEYVDNLKGTLVCVEIISHTQRPYADTVIHGRISCYQPNLYTTNAPSVRVINEAEAKQIAKMFISSFTDTETPEWHQTRLSSIRPVVDPAGVDENLPKLYGDQMRSASWDVVIVRPSTE